MEAINKFYLEDGHIEDVCNLIEEGNDEVVYEVIRILKGIPLFEEEHIVRLEKSFEILKKSFPYQYNKIEVFIAKLINANHIESGTIKLTYNFDSSSMRIYEIRHSYPTNKMYQEGINVLLYNANRKKPNAKVINEKLQQKVREILKNSDAYEALLVDEMGYITEGSKSNIFFIKDNTLITTPLEKVLPGITRDKVINIAKKLTIEVKEICINANELDSIEAMFICGTSPKILPISKINDLNFDINNEILSLLIKKYDEELNKYIHNIK